MDRQLDRGGYEAALAELLEQLKCRVARARIAVRKYTPALARVAAVPSAHAAARAGDDRDEGGDVEWFEIAFDDAVNVACGDHSVGVAVEAVANEFGVAPNI